MKDKKILIIDSDNTDRRIMATFLRKEKFRVDTGKGLSDAVKMIIKKSYDCLVMDVDLPEIKGYESVSVIQRIDPDLRVIITAKKNTKRLEANIRKQNIFYYFIKSFDKEELKQAILNAFND